VYLFVLVLFSAAILFRLMPKALRFQFMPKSRLNQCVYKKTGSVIDYSFLNSMKNFPDGCKLGDSKVGWNETMASAYTSNQDELLERKIPHDYTVRSGGHSWEYWSNTVNYQFLFFSRFFSQAMQAGKTD
jgi:hypothetical protein